jgi:hypothetical protein
VCEVGHHNQIPQQKSLIDLRRTKVAVVEDAAPTELHLLRRLPVSADTGGHVLEESFTNLPPVKYEDADNCKESRQNNEIHRAGAELIEQRLEGLGYVE